jgi:SPP1 gp7 family putative phage head morphogenesis protein
LVEGEVSSMATTALDALGIGEASRSRAAPIPGGPILLEDLERIEKHVNRAWGDGLVDLQAAQERLYLQECEAVIRQAAAERWTPERFRARIGAISQEYGVRGWGAKASTWYRTLILNAGYNRGMLLAFAGTPAKRLFPYLAVVTRRDASVRASHRMMDGFVAKVDWPGWNRLTPPYGWGCRCRLFSISYEIAEASGYEGDFPRGQDFLKPKRMQDDDGKTRTIRPGPPIGWVQPLQVFNDVLPLRGKP